jgi:hypothetical protein
VGLAHRTLPAKARRGLPAYALPVLRLARLAVSVDAKPEAVGFYANLGFQALPQAKGALGDRPEPTPMFLELGAIPRVWGRW